MGYVKPENQIATKARHPLNGVKIKTDVIISALTKSRGNISRAADKIGCCRDTLHTRINQEPAIKQALDNCRERFLDDLEDVFQNKALSGDTVSGLFLLKTIGKRRGYDQDRDVMAEGVTRGVLDFIANRSKNPAES